MLFKRHGYPEEGELVLCTVTKVQFHSVFCDLDEFYNKSGMIHISEVSPGRIRNIRDYVKEGKKVVCVILKISEERGHIDLSLRRVNDSQRRRKMDEIKQEQKAEKIIELLANELKKDFKQLYKEISNVILKEYEVLHLAFNDVVEHNLELSSLGLEKTLAEQLEIIIKDKIKPKQVLISGVFTISIYASDGIEIVKKVLQDAEKIGDNTKITYEGGGRYLVKVVDKEYKSAEATLSDIIKTVTSGIESKDGVVQFERYEK